MLEKITYLKESSNNSKVQALCEAAINGLSTVIYNDVTSDAKFEIERATMENLFNELSVIEEDGVQSWIANEKRIFSLQNLGVREAINKLSEKEGKENPTLQEFLNEFKTRLDNDPEVLLYEEFISGIQSMSYYPEVGSAVDAIAGRVAKYSNDVNLTKILETMKKTRSSYLIPYIEKYIDNYLNDKTEQNKSFLKEALIKFSYDPFVKDIISVVTVDATDLQLEFANGSCDIEKIYSPIIYLGENEAAFNVKGTYYIKKGNNVNRIPKSEIGNLDTEFVKLCETLNRSEVEVVGDIFKVYIGNDYAEISEKKVIINEGVMTTEEMKRMYEASEWAGNSEFLNIVGMIKQNLSEIAEIDFVKRVFLKEDASYFADIFKLRDNVFISTNNPSAGRSTFYRNVNPIQAKNIMMEHLRFDVSRLFESLLPNEKKIKAEISETKKSYVDYMSMLEGKIEAFQHQTPNKVTEDVISALDIELKEVKDEYKDYLNMIERYMLAPTDVDVSDLSEEIKLTIDVNGQKYVVPIPDGTEGTGQTGAGVADDEQQAGTIPGEDEIEDDAASAITFDDDETELLGDSPSIQDDEVDLGAEEAEEDAEEAEEDAESEKAAAEDSDYEEEDDSDLDFDDEGEEDNDQDEEVEKKKKKKKKDKNESLERNSFVDEGTDDRKKQKKVFLKKKKKRSHE